MNPSKPYALVSPKKYSNQSLGQKKTVIFDVDHTILGVHAHNVLNGMYNQLDTFYSSQDTDDGLFSKVCKTGLGFPSETAMGRSSIAESVMPDAEFNKIQLAAAVEWGIKYSKRDLSNPVEIREYLFSIANNTHQPPQEDSPRSFFKLDMIKKLFTTESGNLNNNISEKAKDEFMHAMLSGRVGMNPFKSGMAEFLASLMESDNTSVQFLSKTQFGNAIAAVIRHEMRMQGVIEENLSASKVFTTALSVADGGDKQKAITDGFSGYFKEMTLSYADIDSENSNPSLSKASRVYGLSNEDISQIALYYCFKRSEGVSSIQALTFYAGRALGLQIAEGEEYNPIQLSDKEVKEVSALLTVIGMIQAHPPEGKTQKSFDSMMVEFRLSEGEKMYIKSFLNNHGLSQNSFNPPNKKRVLAPLLTELRSHMTTREAIANKADRVTFVDDSPNNVQRVAGYVYAFENQMLMRKPGASDPEGNITAILCEQETDGVIASYVSEGEIQGENSTIMSFFSESNLNEEESKKLYTAVLKRLIAAMMREVQLDARFKVVRKDVTELKSALSYISANLNDVVKTEGIDFAVAAVNRYLTSFNEIKNGSVPSVGPDDLAQDCSGYVDGQSRHKRKNNGPVTTSHSRTNTIQFELCGLEPFTIRKNILDPDVQGRILELSNKIKNYTNDQNELTRITGKSLSDILSLRIIGLELKGRPKELAENIELVTSQYLDQIYGFEYCKHYGFSVTPRFPTPNKFVNLVGFVKDEAPIQAKNRETFFKRDVLQKVCAVTAKNNLAELKKVRDILVSMHSNASPISRTEFNKRYQVYQTKPKPAR